MFSSDGVKRVGVAIGEYVLDLDKVFRGEFFNAIHSENVYLVDYLNDFISLGKEKTNAVRLLIQDELQSNNSLLKSKFNEFFYRQSHVTMHLPIRIGDFTDFYSSEHHAENVGKLFRDGPSLTPNWKHMPLAYNGRASSIVVSGTDIYRPKGQFIKEGSEFPTYGPTNFLDFELELATIIGKESSLGDVISCDNARDYIFGYALLNDWSARDFQRWEYQPLGPFTAKSFASTMSAWVVTAEALEPFKSKVQHREDQLNYLQSKDLYSYDINLKVKLNSEEITVTNFNNLYWTPSQQIAHHTVNGCNLRVGDVLASGTVSGPEEKGKGCLLEITEGGASPLELTDDAVRSNLIDGDKVELTGVCINGNIKVGFGENFGEIKKTKK